VKQFPARGSCVAAATLAAVAASCWAGPMPIPRRTAGILAADLTLDAIYLVRDLTGDGDGNDPGEATVFLDASNASGITAPTGSVFALFQAVDGTVYIADGDTDSVYAAKDLNDDGDALDTGECRVWFSSFNASLLTMPTPGGVCQGADGAIYITNAGISSSPQDGLYRTVDLNDDGDANDSGEQTVFVDETAIGVLGANPFECSLLGNKVYFLDIRGGNPDIVFVADDADGDGSVSAAELRAFYTAGGVAVAQSDFSCQSDGTSIYVHEATSSQVQSVWRLTDTDISGMIDQATESVAVWTESSLPSGAVMNNSFSLSLGPGMIALSSNGADNEDEIIIARDIDGNGDYNDAGGTAIFAQGVAAVSFPENLRAVLFYGRPCLADVNASGSVTVQDIFDFLALYFSNHPRADINASGSVTVQDIFDFLALYFTGC
jgi:hypothetical protein